MWNGLAKETLEGCLPPQAVVEAGCDSNYRILYGASAAGATAITDSHADKGQRAGGTAGAVLVLHFWLVRAPPDTDWHMFEKCLLRTCSFLEGTKMHLRSRISAFCFSLFQLC